MVGERPGYVCVKSSTDEDVDQSLVRGTGILENEV